MPRFCARPGITARESVAISEAGLNEMSGFEKAVRRAEAGYRLRFYQDFYGRQWVTVQGGWRFWRSGKIYLDNDEVAELKRIIARRRKPEMAREEEARSARDAA